MKHNLIRYEKNKDHLGTIKSIFVATNCVDGKDSVVNEHWLNEDEIKLVLDNEQNLQPILNQMCASGSIRLINEINTKPQPSEFADDKKLNSFVISDAEIAKLNVK